jgi:Heterokaryon incompatibility protein (HET)
MRLLERQSDGGFRFTHTLLDKDIPQYPYTILSHTWGQASEEVTFEDMIEGSGPGKPGYKKIKFCGDQAARDGFKYFWVDSCCIKKSSDAELSESINSMFRWYQRAKKCYVYLSDVSTGENERKRKRGDQNSQNTWKAAFRGSRWFTRGWTLQELLAPVSVEFFSREGKLLGDKAFLCQQLYEITGIALPALQNTSLSQFSINERFKWAQNRQTTREEDWAYCLLGIFDISMPLIYGEGREKAVIRLRKEIKEASNDNNRDTSMCPAEFTLRPY